MATVSYASLPRANGLLWWYALAVLVIVLDQFTKGLATQELSYGMPVEVFSWFNLTLQYNPGAAFSFLSQLLKQWLMHCRQPLRI